MEGSAFRTESYGEVEDKSSSEHLEGLLAASSLLFQFVVHTYASDGLDGHLCGVLSCSIAWFCGMPVYCEVAGACREVAVGERR